MANVKISDLSAAGALTAAELLEIVQSGANVKVTLANLMKVIDALTAETAPATDDEVALFDTSAGTADKITLANLLKVVNALTEDSSPDAANDFLLSYDASASAAKKVKPANLPKGLVPIARITGTGPYEFTTAAAFNGTYRTLVLEGWLQPADDDKELWVRISDDGGSTFEADAADYKYQFVGVDSGATNRYKASSGDTKMAFSANDATLAVGNAADEWIQFEIKFNNPDNTARQKLFDVKLSYIAATGALVNGIGSGVSVATAAVNGVQLTFEGSAPAAGDVTLYGLVNA